jgi:hypothetical protein
MKKVHRNDILFMFNVRYDKVRTYAPCRLKRPALTVYAFL